MIYKQELTSLFKQTIITILFMITLNTPVIIAQEPVTEDIIEEFASQADEEEIDYSSLAEDLNYYLDNPLNLNEANIEKLEKLHFLSEFQIHSLLEYISRRNEIVSIYELQLVDGFSFDIIKKILPFVTISKVPKKEELRIKEALKYGNHLLITETSFLLEVQKGYKSDTSVLTESNNSRYLGNRFRSKLRYKFHYKNRILAGFTAEKDAGETFNFREKPYGFDFYSAHLQLNDLGIIKQINIGDYQAKFGQGLIFWTGFGIGKSVDVLNIRKRGQGLKYYSSTDENNFLRGIGTTIKFGKVELTTFLSYKKVDGNLQQTDSLNENRDLISSFQNSGYHRTLSELQNKKVIDETLIGSRMAIRLKNLKIAANMVGYQYSGSVGKHDEPYKIHDFTGNKNFNASIDYQFFYRKIGIFGETATGKNGALATQNGLITSIVPQISFSMLHRFYQQNYQAYYSNCFSENSKTNNEQGLYYGLEFYPIRKLKLIAYADFYQFPWLKFGVDAPSGGNEYFVQANYILSRNVDFYFRWKTETKVISVPIEDKAIELTEIQKREQFRFHISYKISNFINLRNRIEINQLKQKDSKKNGCLFYQDINFDFKHTPLSFYTRYAVFDAIYDVRSYAYENDILYSFSVPSYSGKGSRIYIMVKYSINKLIDVRVRFAQFFYPNRKSIGSGASEIAGNKKSELKFQLVFKF